MRLSFDQLKMLNGVYKKDYFKIIGDIALKESVKNREIIEDGEHELEAAKYD